MRMLLLLSCVAVLIPSTGVSRPARLRSSQTALDAEIASQWECSNQLAFAHYQKRDYQNMAAVLGQARLWVDQHPPNRHAIKTLIYLGGSSSFTFQYREALREYLLARESARALSDWESAAILSHNLSNLYLHLYALDEAIRAADDSLGALPADKTGIRAMVLMQKGRLVARQGRMEEAHALFRQAIEHADQLGDSTLQASAWELLGWEHFHRNELDLAEPALLEAFRLRKMTDDPGLSTSYQYLAWLRLAQDDPVSALHLINTAIDSARHSSPRLPAWSACYLRAKILAALGRLAPALDDLRAAISQVRDARLHMLPADSLRVSSGVGVQEVYSEFIETAAKLYSRTGDRALLRETLAVAEASRALSLRESSGETSRVSRLLPPSYMQTLAHLQNAYRVAHRQPSHALHRELQQLRLQLTEMEAAAGLARYGIHPAGFYTGGSAPVERLLAPSEALLVFHLDDDRSYLWSVTNRSLHLHALPSRATLAAEVNRFRAAIHADSQQMASSGEALFATLFGALSSEVRARPRWLLVADDVLFQLPFAALVTGRRAGAPEFLIEQYSVSILPGTWALRRSSSSSEPVWRGRPLAVGDPIYNSADPRRQPGAGGPRWLSWFGRAGIPPSAPELARLPGSLREVEACARLWRAYSPLQPAILTGPRAAASQIQAALSDRPAVIHLATHLVPSPENPADSLIALSLGDGGAPELIGPEWIAARDLHPALVFMSGCRSGGGDTLPGEGLMGLTRAWLLAGASSVAATHSPTPDDGGLAQAFYRHWNPLDPNPAPRTPGEALRLAQIEMIRSASFRSRPRYWASYFIVGKS